MELLEKVGIGFPAPAEDEYCEGTQTESKNWKACIDTIKGYQAKPATLREDMLKEECAVPEKAGTAAPWDLLECDEHAFPYQTHHVIPKKELPKHAVCVWLTDSPKKNPTKYKLKSDTDYSIDNWRNGYFMPFAGTTAQWKAKPNRKSDICFEMMRRTKTQLHQGSHSGKDYLEQDAIETKSYKGAVKELLSLVDARVATHVEACEECKGKKSGGKIEVQPLAAVVEQMYLVSEILIALIDRNRIFVSQRAANYYAANRDANGNVRHRPDSHPYFP